MHETRLFGALLAKETLIYQSFTTSTAHRLVGEIVVNHRVGMLMAILIGFLVLSINAYFVMN